MGRLHLLELEDLTWFPSVVRSLVVDHLSFVQELVSAYRPLVPVVEELLGAAAAPRVVDLCSGSGAAPSQLHRWLLERGVKHEVVLTDLYPNLKAFKERQQEGINVVEQPVDATSVPEHLVGLRTLFNAFHHLPEPAAKALLADAVAKRQPILVVETVGRTLTGFGLVFVITLASILLAPLVKPFSLTRLFFTYLVPIVPFVVFFDGVVSCLRVYSPAELARLTQDLEGERYRFEVKRVKAPVVPVWHTLYVGRPS